MYYETKSIITTLFLLFFGHLFSQINPSDGCSGLPSLTVSTTGCITNSYTLPGTFSNGGIVTSACVGGSSNRDDGWYSITPTFSGPLTIELTGDRRKTLAVWSACGAGTEIACDKQNAGTTSLVTFSAISGTTYYLQLHRHQGNNTASMIGSICAYSLYSGPANVTSEIQLWLKAGSTVLNGGSAASDGQAANTWEDLSGIRVNNPNDALYDAPIYRDNAADYVNYRPTVDFDGINDGLDLGNDYIYSTGVGSQNGLTWFAIVEPDDPGIAKSRQFIMDFGLFSSYGYGFGYGNSHYQGHAVNNFGGAFMESTHTGGTSRRLIRYQIEFGVDLEYALDGLVVNSTSLTATSASSAYILESQIPTSGSGPVTIGHLSKTDQLGSQGGRMLDGSLSELIGFSTDLPSNDIQVMESYLALKYGITLDNSLGGTSGDYLSSTSTLFWDASISPGYQNDIIGIGRDSQDPVIQRQSHTIDDSSRIYMNTLAVSNTANSGVFSNDRSFVLMGHNTGENCATFASNVEIPLGLTSCILYSRLEREWKVTNTNYPQNFNVDIALNSCASPTLVNTSELRFLVDDDGDFSNGGTQCYFNGDGSGIVISYANPYITVSNISNSHIPENSIRYFTIASVQVGTPLPVELINFHGTCTPSTNMLSWTTVTETNNDFFNVQRMTTEYNTWNTIGIIQGAGTSTDLIVYRYEDVDPPKDSYYRLLQVDFDGASEVSHSISIDRSQCDNSSINIYPNPVSGYLQFSGISDGLFEFVIEDVTGRIVSTFSANTNTKLDVSFWPSGVYIITIIKYGTRIDTCRIIKQ